MNKEITARILGYGGYWLIDAGFTIVYGWPGFLISAGIFCWLVYFIEWRLK